MNRQIPLWPDTVPGFDEAIGQSKPSVTLFPAEHARGMVLVLPGGGYDHKAAHEGAPIAERLNRGGIAAAVLDYRVAPYRAPVPQWDAMRAVQWLRHLAPEYSYQPDHVAILGFSAGGHLAASVTYLDVDPAPIAQDALSALDPRPDAAVLCYPVITTGPFAHPESIQHVTGGDPRLMEHLSLEKQVRGDMPPCFLWHCVGDEAVPVENSLLLASAMQRAVVDYECHLFAGGAHGISMCNQEVETPYPAAAEWVKLCKTWLNGQFEFTP